MRARGIYRIVVTRPSGVTSNYVGQAEYIKRRLTSHRHALRKGVHANGHLLSAWRLYGEAAFKFEIVEVIPTGPLTPREEHWICHFSAAWHRGGFNQRRVADSNVGLKKSAEAVARSNGWRKGRPLTAEHKAAIGAANRGRRPTAECIRLAVLARVGKPHPALGKPNPRKGMPLSEEAKRRQSEGQKRRWAAQKAAAALAVVPEMLGEAA